MKSSAKGVEDSAPWRPVEYKIPQVAAIIALENGEATADQQRLALAWIVKQACGVHDLAYRPGEDGRRDTDFMLGRQFVGQQILKMSALRDALIKEDKWLT